MITTTASLRASFAIPAHLLPYNTHATNATYDPSRAALAALDAALDAMLDTLPRDLAARLDYLADDFHADPFFHLDIDPNAADDAPITNEMLHDMICAELDD